MIEDTGERCLTALLTQARQPTLAGSLRHSRSESEGTRMQLQRRPSGLPDWLYAAIVGALGLYFIIGGIAWATFIYNGVPVPDSFTTILATIAGGLVGVLAPSGGSSRTSPPRE